MPTAPRRPAPWYRRMAASAFALHPGAFEWRVADSAHRHLPGLLRETGVPGVQVCMAVDDRPALTICLGVADARSGAPVTPSTRFAVASLSKPLSALVAAGAARAGAVDLDRPLDDVLDAMGVFGMVPRERLARVTLRLLLGHAAGVAEQSAPYVDGLPGDLSLDRVLRGEVGPHAVPAIISEPGRAVCYSGASYTLAEHALATLTGLSFPDLARAHVFEPLGLTGCSFDRFAVADAAADHAPDGTVCPPRWTPARASSGAVASAPDLALIFRTLLADAAGRGSARLLGPDLARPLLTRQPPDVADSNFALGLHVSGAGPPRTLDHNGERTGFRGAMWVLPAAGVVAVALANGERGYEVIRPVMGLIRDTALMRPRATIGLRVAGPW